MSDITANRHRGNAESVAAHESIAPDKTRLRQRINTWIGGRGWWGATSDEVESTLGLTHQTVSARITEAKNAGELTDTGRRRATRSGRSAAVYISSELTEGAG